MANIEKHVAFNVNDDKGRAIGSRSVIALKDDGYTVYAAPTRDGVAWGANYLFMRGIKTIEQAEKEIEFAVAKRKKSMLIKYK